MPKGEMSFMNESIRVGFAELKQQLVPDIPFQPDVGPGGERLTLPQYNY
jgi:hypothetical protein